MNENKIAIDLNADGQLLRDPITHDIMYFPSTEEAVAFLVRMGYDTEYISQALFPEYTGMTCLRCGHPLFKSYNSEYTYQCFYCDEDFYSFEQRCVRDEKED